MEEIMLYCYDFIDKLDMKKLNSSDLFINMLERQFVDLPLPRGVLTNRFASEIKTFTDRESIEHLDDIPKRILSFGQEVTALNKHTSEYILKLTREVETINRETFQLRIELYRLREIEKKIRRANNFAKTKKSDERCS